MRKCRMLHRKSFPLHFQISSLFHHSVTLDCDNFLKHSNNSYFVFLAPHPIRIQLYSLTKMVYSSKPPANAFVRVMRKVYNPLGFSKGYNFVLCTSMQLLSIMFILIACQQGSCQSDTFLASRSHAWNTSPTTASSAIRMVASMEQRLVNVITGYKILTKLVRRSNGRTKSLL